MHPSDQTGGRRHPFSPWRATPEQLARTLVGREEMLCDLVGLLASPADSTSNHTLLIGPRGIGKTHLLSLIGHYVAGRLKAPFPVNADLTCWTPVLFTEEEYAGQNTLANFLLGVLAKLRGAEMLEDLWRLPDDLALHGDAAVCECCCERLTRYHTERHRRVLLLIDNVQKVFQAWERADQERFRAFLSGQGFVLIIGSAPTLFKEVMGQRAAFHDFFDIRPVEDLSEDLVLDLVGKWFAEEGAAADFQARKDELTDKLPAIRALTGGNPRLVVFVAQVAVRNTLFEIETALNQLMEELREYFIRRFDELKEQPRKILDTLCQLPGPATPTEIAEAARLPRASVNTQLRRLKKQHYVRTVKLQRSRSTRYDVAERLFRIWRQSASVAGRERLRCTVDFLKLYYIPRTADAGSASASHQKDLLLAGRYAEAVEELEAGLAAEPDDWDLTVDREIALACLGRHGRRMEALPVALEAVSTPADAASGMCDYILEVASGALGREETDIALNLFRSILAMESWHGVEGYGAQIGAFLRGLLDAAPERFIDAVEMVRASVTDENVLQPVDPFLQAAEYVQTGDVGILERLFPEIREIVMEIGERLGRPRPGGLRIDD